MPSEDVKRGTESFYLPHNSYAERHPFVCRTHRRAYRVSFDVIAGRLRLPSSSGSRSEQWEQDAAAGRLPPINHGCARRFLGGTVVTPLSAGATSVTALSHGFLAGTLLAADEGPVVTLTRRFSQDWFLFGESLATTQLDMFVFFVSDRRQRWVKVCHLFGALR